MKESAMRGHMAVLLAAGGSSRLGQSKQELTIGGEPLVRRMARFLLRTNPERLYVVVNTPGMAAHLEGLPVVLLDNPDWQNGLSSSVRIAARALADHRGPTLTATVDQCRLQPEHLDALLAAQDGGYDVVSRYDKENFGIPAVVTARTLQRANELEGDRGFGQIWRRAPERLCFVDLPELAFDLDTPAQLATAIRRGWVDGTRVRLAATSTPATIPTPGVRAIKQERIRHTIVTGATRLFLERGYADTTMEDIAHVAGLSTRTLFRHFENKAGIALAGTDFLTEFLEQSFREMPPGPQPLPWVQASLLLTCTKILERPDFLPLFRFFEKTGDLHAAFLVQCASWESMVARAIEAAPFSKSVAPHEARLIGRVAMSVFRTALEAWAASPEQGHTLVYHVRCGFRSLKY